MNCPEKVSLQQQVKDGWSAYEMAVKESGYRMESANGPLRPPPTSEVISLGLYTKPGVYADALRLRGEHLRASRELSRHLSRHRC